MDKQLDNFEIQYVAVSNRKLQTVERIVELAKDRPTFVDGDKDWEVIWELFVLWYSEYPEQFDEFQKSIAEIRNNLKDSKGMIREDGADLWQRQLEIPATFYSMIKAIYPDQKWDRKFVSGLARRIPILKVADKI
jgi:hypothetical protein